MINVWSYLYVYICRGFGRSCECELPEGVDPNKDHGNGYDQCPLVEMLLWLPLKLYIIIQDC